MAAEHLRLMAAAIVANPGGLRWMRWMATGLAREGLLRTYVTPIAATPAAQRRAARLPRPVSSRVGRELSLRDLPPDVAPSQVMRVATIPELLQVAVQRSPLPWGFTREAMHLRSVAFDRRAARLPRSGDLAVIAASTAGLATLRTASELGVPTFLDYPIAHHAWAERLLSEEARLHPELADTLQFAELPERTRRRMEEEIEQADRILVLTSFQRQTFIESGVDDEKLLVTPLGVELEAFRPVRRDDGRPFRILFAGQLSQRKGLSYALEGFRRAAIPGAELVLLGAPVGSARPWTRVPGVRQLGPVPFGDLPSYYEQSDVFLLPSLVEGLPQTLLQAMAAGLPVVVSENTAGPEIVEDGVHGHVVPIRDPDAIAERLRDLHENPERRDAMGAEARRRAEELPWDAYGRTIADAVREWGAPVQQADR
jgi:glycosyltransferase involved in cell wall biosynthesis